jgi:hypothetical protein
MDGVGVVAPHVGVLRRGRGHARGPPEVAADPHSEEIPATVACIHRIRTVQQASPLDWMRWRHRADAGARSRSCSRRSESRRVKGRKSIPSSLDPGEGPDTDGPSAVRIHLPRLSRPELDRRCRCSGSVSPWCRREPARSVRDAVDTSAVRTGSELVPSARKLVQRDLYVRSAGLINSTALRASGIARRRTEPGWRAAVLDERASRHALRLRASEEGSG